jgi:hypothetical protein
MAPRVEIKRLMGPKLKRKRRLASDYLNQFYK